jgi:hypothetical protein
VTDHKRTAADLLEGARPDATTAAIAQVHATLALVEAVEELRRQFNSDTIGAVGYDVSQLTERFLERG